MQIRLASVMVENQDDALRFYTTVLGFVKQTDIPNLPRRAATDGAGDRRGVRG